MRICYALLHHAIACGGRRQFRHRLRLQRLPFSALLGWVPFTEILDVWTADALIIFAAGYYSTIREAKASGQKRTDDILDIPNSVDCRHGRH